MTKFMVVLSGKGGVGKTTTAINLGTALSNFGRDVIVLDANLSTPHMGLQLGAPVVPVSLNDAMSGEKHIQEAVYLHPGGLKIVPSSISLEDLKKTDPKKLKKLLSEENAFLDAIYYCPHHPEVGESPYRKNCDCRKPKPGLLQKAEKDLHIDLSRSYIIGDSIKDIETGFRVGMPGVLVLTGYGKGEYEYHSSKWSVRPIHIADNLTAAVNWILSREGRYND